MEDELEDRILYQTYVSHMKLISRYAVGVPLNFTPFGYVWRLLRLYILRPEVFIFSAVVFLVLIYLQTVDLWSHSLISRIQYSIGRGATSKVQRLSYFVNGSVGGGDKISWELKEGEVAAYAVQGRRPKMEDRFVVNDDINGTGVSLYAVFDGHGGEFAANYARDNLITKLNQRLIELKKLIASGDITKHPVYGFAPPPSPRDPASRTPETPKKNDATALEKRNSFRKAVSTAASTTDECVKKGGGGGGGGGVTDPELLQKLNMVRPITREVRPSTNDEPVPTRGPAKNYIDSKGGINYNMLLEDEVLAADHLLVEAAKKSMDVAGTTALIAVIEGSRLIVANVGDSRGVMCDSRGKAIPLSFDHKPQQVRERKRIREAGGFITYNGVWRVAGILATSRALGDYPLKDKKLVIAKPDILTFDLIDHKPQFIILASDGLWDTFSNEEAVAFVRERLSEPHYGAKSITLQSYFRGSLDNITVVVINLKNKKWNSTTNASSKKTA